MSWRQFRRRGGLGALVVFLALTVLIGPQVTTVAAAGPQRPDVRDDELLVKFRPGTPGAVQAALHAQAGGQVVREIVGLDVKVVKVAAGQAQQRLQGYLRNPNVQYAELNGIAYPDAAATDPLYPQQWALNNIGQTGGLTDKDIDAPQAWDVTGGSAAVTIAIVDTGVRATHPDLAGKVTASQSWTTATSDPNDYYGHGTHVAGIAAAAANNAQGISGVCQSCSLINAKVCDDNGGCPYDFVANGLLWSVGCDWRQADGTCFGLQHARAINVSLGGTYASQTLQDAVDKAWSLGAVLACAAGNNGTSSAFYPAAYTNCIAVAATDNRDQKASWSNYSRSWVDVAAPGVNILSTMIPSGNAYFDGSGYGQLSGTSMASPHVAGLAGLLAAKGLNASQIRTQIESTADRITGTGTYWAKGRINACRAVGGRGC
jgi:thermitase